MDMLPKYGLQLFVVLLAVNVFALIAYNRLEHNEERAILQEIARQIEADDTLFQRIENEGMLHLPDGVVVLRPEDRERDRDRQGERQFDETTLNNREYITYTTPQGYLLAAPERDIKSETTKISVLLGLLFLAQVGLFIGWWHFVRTSIEDQFIVK